MLCKPSILGFTHVTRKPPFELQRSIVKCPNKSCLNLQERFTTPSPFSTLVSDVLDVVVPVVKIGLVMFCKASSKCNFLWIVSGRSLRANTINPSSRTFSVFGDSPSQSSSVVACDSKEGHSLPNFTRRWTRVSQNLICKSIGARNFFLTSEYRAARYNVKGSLECSFEGGAFVHRWARRSVSLSNSIDNSIHRSWNPW